MKLKLSTLALTAMLALGAGIVHAQDDETTAEKADEKADINDKATAADKAAARAARIERRRARIAARREAKARAEAAAPRPSEPAVAPQPEAVAMPAHAHLDKAAPVDAEAPLDTQPALAPAHAPAAPAHPAAGHDHSEPAAAHGAAAQVAGHQTSGETHGAAHGDGKADHGAGHGEHAGFSGTTFALQLLNFGVLLFILIWFGGRAMNKSLRARHEQLKGDIDAAARLRDEAAQKFKAQDQRVADLEKEIAALRASLRQDAEREQARLLEGAQERAKKIQDEMRFQLDQQVKEAELLLRAEVAGASVKLAEELVRKSLNTDDERRLAQEFVAGFAGVGGPTGPEGAVG